MKVSEFKNTKFLPFEKGIRMDDETNNYVIFRNYINLSFSYMTFVIEENFKQKVIMHSNEFD
jgi:hypothetical protein